MTAAEAAASVLYLAGVVPAGVYAFRHRRASGVAHVVSRATFWPPFALMAVFLGREAFEGSPHDDA